MNISTRTRRAIEKHAYNRAADLAKSYAEHWEREARTADTVADPSNPATTSATAR